MTIPETSLARISVDQTFDLAPTAQATTTIGHLALGIADLANRLVVDSAENEAAAVNAITNVKAYAEAWEAERDAAVAPLDDLIEQVSAKIREVRDQVHAQYRLPIKTMIAVGKRLREQVKEYRDGLKAQVEALPGLTPEQVIEVAREVSAPMPTGSHMRTTWRAVVVDPELIPREWLQPNTTLLNKEARRVKGESTIPGVQFESESVLVVNS